MTPDVAALLAIAPDLRKPGCYVLRLRLPQGRKIRVGKLGAFLFGPGEYLYVGSARSGLARRLARYFRGGGKMWWHIDYLLRLASIEGLWYCVGQRVRECEVSRLLQGEMEGWPRGFGSSDCRCKSHLYESTGRARGVTRKLRELHYLGWGDAGGSYVSAFEHKGG